MNVTLGEGYGYLILPEGCINFIPDLTFYVLHLKCLSGPEVELEIKRGVAKILKPYERFGRS